MKKSLKIFIIIAYFYSQSLNSTNQINLNIDKLDINLNLVQVINSPYDHIQTNHNTYKGIGITPENIYSLSIKPSQDLANQINSTLSKSENLEIINNLLHIPKCHDINQFREAIVANEQYMINNNLKNLTDLNYTFSLDNPNFVFQVSGLCNTIRTLISSSMHIDPYSRYLSEFPISELTGLNTPTYQHVSRVAHYLRLAELQEHMDHIKVVPVYLIPLKNSDIYNKNIYTDRNTVVVQEKYDTNKIINFTALSDPEKTDFLNNLPNQAIIELFIAIKNATLWDIETNLKVNLENPTEIWIADYEQPNNSDSRDFYYHGLSGYKKYINDANCGLNKLREILEKYAPNKLAIWYELENIIK